MLFQIIKLNNIPGLKKFCHTYKDYEQIDEVNYYPLHYAIVDGNFDIVKILIENGADINFNYRETPLICAAKHKKDSIFNFLLRSGADITSLDEKNENVLFQVVRNENYEVVEKLVVGKKIPINILSSKNESPLSIAIGLKNIKLIQLLLENGADPNVVGNNCLKAAINTKDQNIEQLLIQFGAKEEVRISRVSRNKQFLKDKRKKAIDQRSPKANQSRDGECLKCQATTDLMKLIPCGHAVICKNCAKRIIDIIEKCPVCNLCFMATTTV